MCVCVSQKFLCVIHTHTHVYILIHVYIYIYNTFITNFEFVGCNTIQYNTIQNKTKQHKPKQTAAVNNSVNSQSPV